MANTLESHLSCTNPSIYHTQCFVVVLYSDVIMGTVASKITSLTIVYSTVYSDADQRKHQSSASLAFVWGIHRRPGNSPHKCPVTQEMFSYYDVIPPPPPPLTLTSMVYRMIYANYITYSCLTHNAGVINLYHWKMSLKNTKSSTHRHTKINTQAKNFCNTYVMIYVLMFFYANADANVIESNKGFP